MLYRPSPRCNNLAAAASQKKCTLLKGEAFEHKHHEDEALELRELKNICYFR